MVNRRSHGVLALLFGLCCLLVNPCHGQVKSGNDNKGKAEGWANVPGGTVFLRPGQDAYEHDTGLVRDLRTGQRTYPITPQSLSNRQPAHAPQLPQLSPVVPQPIYAWPSNPYLQPNWNGPSKYYPAGPTGYDYGPGNIYANQPCNSCGAKLGSPGAINGRWPKLQ